MMIFNRSVEPGLVLCDFRIANIPLTFKKHQTIRFALGSKVIQMWPAVRCFKQNYIFSMYTSYTYDKNAESTL